MAVIRGVPFWPLQAVVVVCALPILNLTAQLPLWALSTYFGWRVEKANDTAAEKRQPLSIVDISTGTTVVGLCLGIAGALSIVAYNSLGMQLKMVAIFVAMSLTVLLPSIIFVLRVTNACVGIGLHFANVALITLVAIAIATDSTNSWPSNQVVFAILWGSLAFGATAAAPLFAWRACGYRLVWPRDGRRQAGEAVGD